ncbi:pirin family protein, partial [Micrococcus sp. SIMBA_144]
GEFAGRLAPTRQYTPLVGVDIQMQGQARVDLALVPEFEYGVFVITGEPAIIDGTRVELNDVAYLGTGNHTVQIKSTADTR